ncbi:MAG: hypothetical protein LDL41_06300 [Coleofasciculus sp. S288]|nr:hypothetical protein [Coleofasciculus sp. S288]
MGEELNQNKPKIAVVAVHGVADQSPHDSARTIASLLLNHNQSEKQVQYTPFYESTLRIAVRPVRVAKAPKTVKSKLRDLQLNTIPINWLLLRQYNCMAGILFLRKSLSSQGDAAKVEELLDQNAHRYMWEQLNQYKGEGVKSTYETVKLEGSRLQGNEPQANVHIYEMYWADLSRLGTGFRILGEFYQLSLEQSWCSCGGFSVH